MGGQAKLTNGEESQEKGSLLVGVLTGMGPVGAFQGAGNLCLIWGPPRGYVCKKLSSCILKRRTLYDQLYFNLKIILRRKKTIKSSARFGNPLHGHSMI